jgi:CDP-glucose 4,6-dehydratase
MGARYCKVENLVIDPDFWRDRRVFLTGHTGFKGAWMALVLHRLGAKVHGFALAPLSDRDIFVTAKVNRTLNDARGDIRDLASLQRALEASAPEIVIHMAAQSLVRRSYAVPVETYATNVMGTVHVLEALRSVPSVRAAVVVTSDKCYEDIGAAVGHLETDSFGGHDPYSSSKGCAEIVTNAYRRSFFQPNASLALASARAGNVIGGGDWAQDRLVPDAMRAFIAGKPLRIRNPHAERPWQHVLDPVLGYLVLAERLIEHGHAFAEGWNFGPSSGSEVPVATIAHALTRLWGNGAGFIVEEGPHPHEVDYLKLDCAKARSRLGWRALVELDDALRLSVEWYRALWDGRDVLALTLQQIDQFLDAQALALTHPAV